MPTNLRLRAAAPTPPQGPTTLTSYAAMVVGVIVAALSLFDVVPTDEDVQALGVIVGAVLAVVPYVVMAISRTKQANNLAKLAQGERLANPPHLVNGGTFGVATESVRAGEPVKVALKLDGEEVGRAIADATRWPDAGDVPERSVEAPDEVLGAPLDKSLEVPGGGARPEDLEAAKRHALAAADAIAAEIAANEPGISDEVRS